MAKVRVIAGDFRKGTHSFNWNAFSLVSDRGPETILLDRLRSVEIADEKAAKRFVGSAALGAVGAIALGPLGLLAGVLAGGNGREVTFVGTFVDGRQLLAIVDGSTFTKLQASTFRTLRQQPRAVEARPGRAVPLISATPANEADANWRRFAPELAGNLTSEENGQVREMIRRNESSSLERYCTKLIRDQCGDAAGAILARCSYREV